MEARTAGSDANLPLLSPPFLPLQVHGAEVCFFAMYVQEYGSDCPEPNTNRVYISYLDSVRYFESSPEGHRTTVYHSMLISYLQYAKDAGYTHAHIWVAPPKQGDDYIFYAHPEAMIASYASWVVLSAHKRAGPATSACSTCGRSCCTHTGEPRHINGKRNTCW